MSLSTSTAERKLRYLDVAISSLIQACRALQESGDTFSKGFIYDLECINEELSEQYSAIFMDKVKRTPPVGAEHARLRAEVNEYLDMLRRRDAMRDD